MEVMEVTVEGIELETLRLQLLLLSAPDVMELATQGARVVAVRLPLLLPTQAELH